MSTPGELEEVAMKLTNPFWKDVLSSYHLVKPYTKFNTDDILSLDILNFVPVTDLTYYNKLHVFFLAL
jgi:hypothetical protein